MTSNKDLLGEAGVQINILLGVCNGSTYLDAQLESILAQREPSWKILSRDDGSQDHSPRALKDYSARRDLRMILLKDGKGNLGVTGNYGLLAEKALQRSCQYMAFSDQDDVWASDKLSIQLAQMKKMEEKWPGAAILIHSDLELVDAELAPISPSFMRYKGIYSEISNPLKVLLANNFVTGCTVLVNRRLLEIALPFPKEAILHDWWLALCAAVFGQIKFINKPLVKYRQHENNEIGANSIFDLMNPFKANVSQYWLRATALLSQTIAQAGVLSERVKALEPSNPHLPLIRRYASLAELPPLQRIKELNRLGVHGQGFLRHFFLVLRLLNLSQEK